MNHSARLPWPPQVLSPNARPDRRTHAASAKKYRRDCAYACMAAKLAVPAGDGALILYMDFYPPRGSEKRPYDDDGLVARFKAGRDGVADALGINDREFVARARLWTNGDDQACVYVTLSREPK